MPYVPTARCAIQVDSEGVIYSNPLPQLRSRKAFFPGLVRLSGGRLMTAFALGEAMESVDQTTVLYESADGGKIWQPAGNLIPLEKRGTFSDSAKLTALPDGQLAALGYRYDRSNPDLPIGNPATGGLLNSEVFFCRSGDGGRRWSDPRVIHTSFRGPVEASAPLSVLSDGAWVAPIANFRDWTGHSEEGLHGRLLRSDDRGATWSDRAVTMRFPGGATAVWEQRLCEYLPRRLAVLAWVEDLAAGRGYDNQAALSSDGGQHFEPPMDTGIHGQAASLAALGGGLVLSLHSMRRQVSKPGILATVTDLSRGRWEVLAQRLIWRAGRVRSNSAMPEVFSAVRFGQPSAIPLGEGAWMVVFWREEDGEASVRFLRVRIRTGE